MALGCWTRKWALISLGYMNLPSEGAKATFSPHLTACGSIILCSEKNARRLPIPQESDTSEFLFYCSVVEDWELNAFSYISGHSVTNR